MVEASTTPGPKVPGSLAEAPMGLSKGASASEPGDSSPGEPPRSARPPVLDAYRRPLSRSQTELHDKSLDKLHALLPPVFERIHKSYIVKMSTVAGLLIHEGSRYEVERNNGLMLPVGRTRY